MARRLGDQLRMTLGGIPETVGPYRIEERLGAGGMGVVYRAYDQRLDRRVALKHIHPDRQASAKARERFLREARVAARLNHPALVHVHDILEEEGLWIVMELAEGERLDQIVARGPLSLELGLELARQITSGLAAIHVAGILHRDLKTQNVIITPAKATESGETSLPPRARILDFGLARPDDQRSSLSSAGDLLGTPRAMSPEQARGGGEIDHLSDLFSLGILLYEMFTGRPPFPGPGVLETLGQICHLEQDPITDLVPDLPVELSRLVDQLLEKDAGARPRSAEEVVGVLDRLLRPEPDTGSRRSLQPSSGAEGTLAKDFRDSTSAESEVFRRRGERRQLTVLCCELVQVNEDLSTASLDPEALYEVLPRFKEIVDRALRRFGGYLGDFQGHRLVVYFGYPQAFEDAGRRAVMTALEIVARSKALAGEQTGAGASARLVARAGLHTGPAVILTSDGSPERFALGRTLDLATAIQESAGPGQVLSSPATLRLVEGLFREEECGPLRDPASLKPLPLVRIVDAHEVQSRVESLETLPPIIARRREIDFLADRYRLAQEGAGQALLISGAAGVGKTRLLLAAKEKLTEKTNQWFVARGSRYHRDRELFPVAGLMRQILDSGMVDQPQAAPDSTDWRQCLEAIDVPLEEVEPFLDSLLDLRLESEGALTAEEHRSASQILPDLLLEISEPLSTGSTGALVLVFEDLQWCDGATLGLVGQLVDRCASFPILLLLTCRSDFQFLGQYSSHLTRLQLQPLDDSESIALVESLAQDSEMAGETCQAILRRGEGVPLYLEELTREALEGHDPSGEAPSTLSDRLTATLDQLGSGRELVQIAANLPTFFTRQDLLELWPSDGDSLDDEISRLLESKIWEQKNSEPKEYCFRKLLLQEAALATLL